MSSVNVLTVQARSDDVLVCSFTPAEADVLHQLLRIGYNMAPPPIRDKWVGGVIERLEQFSHAKIDYPPI